ncbi:hypothetical protein [Flavobacterium sp.]|uniref:hypothetical protein n=1 Tax=Flavobacterium sp. TaxID=239 RepID=UPI00248969D4|nr:hypothetical protein [Flavobacterium sp.]MDI1316222.1 hypothetical protein [Flavobacterium sp.]
MRLNSRIHGAIDYGVVMFLLISPVYFGLATVTSTCTYILGIVHFFLTLFTKFELGIVKIIPFKIHGMIELGVAIILVGLGFYLGKLEGDLSKYYYLSFAIAVFATWLITDYNNTAKQ